MTKKQRNAMMASLELDLVDRLYPEDVGADEIQEERISEARTLLAIAIRQNREALLSAVCVKPVEVTPIYGPQPTS